MRISFMNFAVGSLALCLLSASALGQETSAAGDSQSKVATSTEATQPAAAATTAEAAAPAVTPPASPVVTFEKGQLTVIGNNATLSDILNAIQQKTGAVIESAAGMSTETVIGQYGPASPATVITELLNGTSLNYVLVGSSDAGQLAKVLLSIRPAHVDVQSDEGGRRHRRGLAEAAALEAQPDLPQSDVVQAAIDSNSHRRRRHAGNDVVPDSTDKSKADNASTDGSTPAADPNTTASAADAIGATGLAPGSQILPTDAPPNIMKAIQHGPGRSPSPAGGSSGYGPAASSLGGSSMPIPTGSGSTYTLPNGAVMLGPGIPLPNGAIFFPGGANIPLK